MERFIQGDESEQKKLGLHLGYNQTATVKIIVRMDLETLPRGALETT
jgi:hypothetical protein